MREEFRIQVNDSMNSVILDRPTFDEKWAKVEEHIFARGGYAKAQRRKVSSKSFEGGLEVGEVFISPWTTYVELES